MDWRHIPSIFALRAFDAVARQGSLTRAAAGLNVTHAAISQHIRKLEEELNLPLTHRKGRGIGLTREGRALADALQEGFDTIAAGVEAIHREREDRPLHISLTQTFAEGWLIPRLGRFWAAHPDIGLTLSPTPEVVDFAREGVDLAIRYGFGDWPGLRARRLTSARFQVLSVADAPKDIPLPERVWLIETLGVEQRRWAEDQGFMLNSSRVREFQSFPLAYAALRAGVGVMVGQAGVVQPEVLSGELDVLEEDTSDDLAYHVVIPERGPRTEAEVFAKWLIDEIPVEVSSPD